MRDFVIGIFIAAARHAARWPHPHRFLARDALCDLPVEAFDGELWAEAVN
jgi:hypothetical protein